MPNFFKLYLTISLMNNKTFQILTIVTLFSLLSMGGFMEISFADEIEPPKTQLRNGVELNEIICKPGYVLVILYSDKPACLTPDTVIKLEERDYITSIVQKFDQNTIEIKDDVSSIPDVEFSSTISGNNASTISGNTGVSSTPKISNIPASQGSIVNFYITDDDLNLNRNGIDIVETSGVLEFLVNGIPIEGPSRMVETGPTTGQFFVRLQLPDSVNGKPLSQDDIVEIRYIDNSDATGNQQISVKSIPLSQTYAKVETSGGGKTRIGHDFTVRIYEPDANLDSKDVDRISLNRIEYRGEGGIRTPLTNPAFDANGAYLRETGDSTGIFEAIIEIPRTIDGKTIHIGDWYELRYIDVSTPSNSSEKIILKGRIG